MDIRIPDENEPGYFKREKRLLEYLEATGIDRIEKRLEWLADYVKAKSRDEAKEVLMEASEAEIKALIEAINKGRETEEPDPKESENSGDG